MIREKVKDVKWFGNSIRETLITSNLKELLYKYNNGTMNGLPMNSFYAQENKTEELKNHHLELNDEELKTLDQKPLNLFSLFGRRYNMIESVSNQQKSKPITVRSKFDPNGAFLSLIKTDENGKINQKLKIPESLTKYRIMAIATSPSFQMDQQFQDFYTLEMLKFKYQ